MNDKTEWTLQVAGMSCGHCSRAVDEALGEVDGVIESRTDHAAGRSIVVAAATVDLAALRAAVDRAGYRVTAGTTRPLP